MNGLAKSGDTSYAYDDGGHLRTISYPGGEVVTVIYNAVGQPTNVSGAHPYVSLVKYDIFGRPTEILHGNGVKDIPQYGSPADGHRLAHLTTQPAGSSPPPIST